MKKAAFYTLGCKVNQYETQAVAEIFKEDGYQVVGFDEEADVYVINTCTVTGFSDKKSRQMIRKARSISRQAVVVAMGCYSQVAPEDVASLPEVDLIIGTKNRKKILEYIKELKGTKINVVETLENAKYESLDVSLNEGHTRATLKIQDGCNQFCSYCIIPYARGPARSRKAEDILEEAKRLADNGFKEIVLTGINLALYEGSFIEVAKSISELESIQRIRIGSMEPSMVTEEFVELVANYPKLCPHFHISLQSGCDATLKRMNRRYTSREYWNAVELLKRRIKDVAVSTDVIVGFPGETDEEFSETYAFLDKLSLSKTHVFKYSARKGTAAAKFSGQISPMEKEKRSKSLIELSDRKAREFNFSFIGREMSVLFENSAAGIEGYLEGFTTNYIKVICQGDENLRRKIVNVKLCEARDGYMQGELLC